MNTGSLFVFNFRNRLALFYMIATAVVIAVVYGSLYLALHSVLYRNIDRDLSIEASKHAREAVITPEGDIAFAHKDEWVEREHHQAEVNPVFIQIVNLSGRVLDKSPNLKDQALSFNADQKGGQHFTTALNGQPLRQVQVPMHDHRDQVNGYMLAALSLESSLEVLQLLQHILLISFPLILLGLFFISRSLTGAGIRPLQKITQSARAITQRNLYQRVPLPERRDEIYELGHALNSLLERVERTVLREREFAADASHQLRTPLTALRGQLELLLRRPRSPEEYQSKIAHSLQQIDRMTGLVEQLLDLARQDSLTESPTKSLDQILRELAQRYRAAGYDPSQMPLELPERSYPQVAHLATELVIDNLLSNALKHSPTDKPLSWGADYKRGFLRVWVCDYGPGIAPEDRDHLFTPFFRGNGDQQLEGRGLGLSIAQRAVETMGATLDFHSQPGEKTCFDLVFPGQEAK